MNAVIEHVLDEKRPMRTLRRECAESLLAAEMLPAWARRPDVAATVPMIQAICGGLWAIDQYGLADAERCQDLDPAACFVWTPANLLEDEDVLSNALRRWPDLEGRFDAGGDGACPASPAVVPLLMVMGAVRCAAETMGVQAAGLCDVTRPGLADRVWVDCVQEAIDLTRRAGPVNSV